MTIKFYEVGGCIRDEFLGIESKDIDFTVVGAPNFEYLISYLEDRGFKIFQISEDHWTIRASVPKGHQLSERTKVADFVLARKDGPTKDGRHPLWVKPGTLKDDLSRRDFTINALARDVDTGEIIDYFNGQEDIKSKTLKFVGDPFRRIDEDGLRILRGWRFMITKGLSASVDTHLAMVSELARSRLNDVSIERIREELDKMFKHDSLKSMEFLARLSPNMKQTIFRNGLRLQPTLKDK